MKLSNVKTLQLEDIQVIRFVRFCNCEGILLNIIRKAISKNVFIY